MYRGGADQWAWAAHRVTGVAVLLFLLIHILDTALIMLGPDWYNKVIAIYRLPIFGIMEILLFAAVLYHALNGVRIVLFDFWVNTIQYHKQLLVVQMVIFIVVFLPVAWLMLGHALQGAH